MVTITNTGITTLTDFAGGAPFDPQFGATQNCAGGVAPGASCQYTFTFQPTATGVFSSTSNSSTNAGPFSITLRGQSGTVPAEAHLMVTPAQVTPGGASQVMLTLTNRNRAAMVDDVAVEIALPTGVAIGAVPNAALARCGGGVLTAAAGDQRIRLGGARIGRGDTCELHVALVGKTVGAYTIRTSAISSANSGTSAGVSAPLRGAAPTFSAFLPLVRR